MIVRRNIAPLVDMVAVGFRVMPTCDLKFVWMSKEEAAPMSREFSLPVLREWPWMGFDPNRIESQTAYQHRRLMELKFSPLS